MVAVSKTNIQSKMVNTTSIAGTSHRGTGTSHRGNLPLFWCYKLLRCQWWTRKRIWIAQLI